MSRPISAAYLERKLRAITGVMGDNPLPSLEALAGFLILENDRPEWMFPANEMLGASGAFSAQAIGNFSYIAITNPVGSGVLSIIEEAHVSPNAAGGATNTWALLIEIAAADGTLGAIPGAVGTSRFTPRDTRLIQPNNLTPLVTTMTFGNAANPFLNAPNGVTSITTGITVNGSSGTQQNDQVCIPFILKPGSRLWIVGQVVNTQIDAWASNRERAIEGGSEMR